MSAHPNNSHGTNPDYYAETNSVAGGPAAELSGGTPPTHQQGSDHAAAAQQPPQYQEQVYPPPPSGHLPAQQNQEYYPPPPAGPPPTSQHQQDYYPPPPSGPPPNQTYQPYHPLQSNPTDHHQPPPSYEPTPGLNIPEDEKPPILPPRPNSRPGSSQGQGQVPYFAPPPGGAEMHGAGPPTAQQHGYGAPAAGAAGVAGAAGAAGGHDHVTDAKKKKSFGERFYDFSVKAGVPVNKLTNKLGSEAFWPTSMDKECDKSARILKSFCKDGFYTESNSHPPPSPGHATNPGPAQNPKAKTLVKIPAKAIAQAKGIAIFTVFRTGLHISGASGSGIVMSRLPDGSWSPPSGFLVHTLGAGFMVGLDIYDCVCVLNTEEAVKAFTKPRFSLGGEIAVVAGPVGAGASLDAAVGAGKPVWSYMKSRGFYAGIQADGTVIVQRPDANAAFYAEKGITPERVLRGEVKPHQGLVSDGGKGEIVPWPLGARQLMEVLKSAEGGRADEKVVEEVGKGPTPGDLASTGGVGHEKETEAYGGGGLQPQGSVRYA
ncbi:hypothetical protein SCAR479_02515 [Seiridium cardinale]|uniref:Ysc84 actin-binding domain-containing protein n=1 Tax=Seiridium cardinale TaxID=138064 RepID=A0ABR2Y369_9PEZI